ncbi:hypothetical protein RF11_14289 [Thelohanellus kitauei]|uniref:Uncharacterized protein n=1 Tax=Thelohanellus kitauei TaxID=669202 RepID=A0A0C2JE80_THEKT|nr:hypothetical protein RF11_14289 [Thelohanellus kitauei]
MFAIYLFLCVILIDRISNSATWNRGHDVDQFDVDLNFREDFKIHFRINGETTIFSQDDFTYWLYRPEERLLRFVYAKGDQTMSIDCIAYQDQDRLYFNNIKVILNPDTENALFNKNFSISDEEKISRVASNHRILSMPNQPSDDQCLVMLNSLSLLVKKKCEQRLRSSDDFVDLC